MSGKQRSCKLIISRHCSKLARSLALPFPPLTSWLILSLSLSAPPLCPPTSSSIHTSFPLSFCLPPFCRSTCSSVCLSLSLCPPPSLFLLLFHSALMSGKGPIISTQVSFPFLFPFPLLMFSHFFPCICKCFFLYTPPIKYLNQVFFLPFTEKTQNTCAARKGSFWGSNASLTPQTHQERPNLQSCKVCS